MKNKSTDKKNIEQEILQKIKQHFPGKNSFLLAVSGGPDSTVLAHVFHSIKIPFEIAHCNFQLRGEESDDDENFVRELGKKLGAKVHVKHISISKNKGDDSIQLQAREKRYEWFLSLLEKYKFNAIVLGHTANDQTETVFLNLMRGTGLNGLTGMEFFKDKKFRPLLHTEKDDILFYAQENKIKFRIDSSNEENKYRRNFVRNEIIQRLEKEWPSLHQTMAKNIERFRVVEKFYQKKNQNLMTEIVTEVNDQIHIDINQLSSYDNFQTTLYELLRQYGFSSSVSQNIFENPVETETRKFLSPGFELEVKSGIGILSPVKKKLPPREISVGKDGAMIQKEFKLEIKSSKDLSVISNRLEVKLDADLVKGNLTVRRWGTGDKFRPLGMRGMKMLSDFFTDLKLSVDEKEKVWLLCDESKILWVIGHRIDDRVKITPDTKNSLHLICRKLN